MVHNFFTCPLTLTGPSPSKHVHFMPLTCLFHVPLLFLASENHQDKAVYKYIYIYVVHSHSFAANLLKKQSHVLASIANDASALSFDPGWAGCGESCFLEDEQRQTIMCTQQFCVSHSYVVHSHSFAANLLKKQSHVLASIANDASALSFDPNQVFNTSRRPQNTLVNKGVGWGGCLFALLCSAVATAAAILERLVNEQLMHEKDDGKEDEGMAGLPKSMGSPKGTIL